MATSGSLRRTCVSASTSGLAALALCAGIAGLGRTAGQAAAGPVYTLPALAAQLERAPRSWLGRPLRVRAMAGVCEAWTGGTWCRHWVAALADPDAPSRDGALPIAPGDPGLPALLRDLPLVGRLVPAPVQPTGAVGVYRVKLRAVPCPAGGSACYQAVLLAPAAGLL